MSRLIFLFAIAVVIYLLVKSYHRKKPLQDKKITDDMVCCEHCGVHLPKSESVRADDHFFCSIQHRNDHLG